MRARGDAAFLIGGLYLNKVCSYNGLGNRRVSAGNKVSPATVCATVVPFYRVTVKHLSTSRRNAASEQPFSLPITKKWDTVKHALIENLPAS
jgi:hypothetical protein